MVGISSLLSIIAGAARGIELSDEAFYWLQMRYWQQLDFQFSFFGAYFDGLFALLQQRIDLMRMAGAVLILASSGVLFWQMTRYLQWQSVGLAEAPRRLIALAALLGLTHYGYMWTLRGPSYNTVAFLGCALTSAALLTWLRRPERRTRLGLVYGLLLGLTLLCKVTTAVLLVPLHFVILLLHHRDWYGREFLRLAATATLGLGVNVGYLTFRHPDWWHALLNGLAYQTTIETRDPLLALLAVLWSWQREAPRPVLAVMALAVVAQTLLLRRGAVWAAMLCMLGSLAALGAWMLFVTQDRGGWLLVIGLASVSMVTQLVQGRWRLRLLPWLPIAGLMFGLPMAYSFGTNAPLAEHTWMAAPFPLCGLLCGLWALRGLGRIGSGGLALGGLLLSLPVLAPAIWPWLNVAQTYRLRGPLLTANVAMPDTMRYRELLTDPQTADALVRLSATLTAAGFQPGQPMMEFTGGHPGLIDVLAARPLGVAWLLGSYPGSTMAAGVVVSRVSVDVLRRTWLISSADASRRIVGWDVLLDSRLGQRCHERVASLSFSPPFSARHDQPDRPIELSVWRPLAVCQPGGLARAR